MGCFMFSAVFWGVIVVIIGLSIILRAFGIKIPVMSIMFGLLFVYIGMSILTCGFGCKAKCKAFMNDLNVLASDAKEGGETVRVKTIFGESRIKIDTAKPVRVRIKAVFASAKTPDGNVISFGEYTYNTDSAKTSKSVLNVEVDTVFGGVNILDK